MPDVTLSRFKRTVEEFRIGWDFVNDIETGDTIASIVVSAVKVDDNTSAASFIESPDFDGTVLSVQIQAGTSGKQYDVTFKATTTQGDVFARVVRVPVQD